MGKFKLFGIVSFSLFVGIVLGFQWNESRYERLRQRLADLDEIDVDEFLRLKSSEERYAKAEEILGKAILIFLEDLRLRTSDQALAFARKSTEKPSVPLSPPSPSPSPSESSITIGSSQSSPLQNSKVGESPKSKEEVPTPSSVVVTGASPLKVPENGVYGKVIFEGPLPARQQIRMNADPVCAKETGSQALYSESVLVGPNGGLAGVFVYVKSGVNQSTVPPLSQEKVLFDQRGCRYVPHVIGLRVGQTLAIQNSDPTLHNVHALPKLNPGFNMGMATKGQVVEKKFFLPEVMIKIKCDVHGWMTSYLGVLNHPYFSVTDNDGNYSIPGLPPGNYVMETWHESFGTRTSDLILSPDRPTQNLAFTYPSR